MASDLSTFEPDYAIPPGATLEEVLEHIGMSRQELADRMSCDPQLISEIISGRKAITQETALRLESVLDVPARFWHSLESQYRDALRSSSGA